MLHKKPVFHQDLLNFDDPLNVEAADHYARDKVRLLSFKPKYILVYMHTMIMW